MWENMWKIVGYVIFIMTVGCVASFGLRKVIRWLFSIDEIIELLKEIKDEI